MASPYKLIALGASTGGTEALLEVLVALPADCPPIVVAIHMPEKFTKSYAERLNRLCPFQVKEAEDGERLTNGKCLIAPGNFHLEVQRSGAAAVARVNDLPPVNCSRPSVDVLFQSVAKMYAASALGVILTGMGRDGAKGLLTMRQAGASTVAQNEATCVVFGMPRAAIQLGAAQQVLPLSRIGPTIATALAQGPVASGR